MIYLVKIRLMTRPHDAEKHIFISCKNLPSIKCFIRHIFIPTYLIVSARRV